MTVSRLLRLDSHWSLLTAYAITIGCAVFVYRNGSRWYVWNVACPLIGLIWPLWFVSGGIRLAAVLRSKGYGWARWWNCIVLQIHAPGRTMRAPPRDEVAILPDYTDSAQGLLDVLKARKREAAPPD